MAEPAAELADFTGVTRFYSHIRARGRLVSNEEDGFEFADIETAEREAALMAMEIARDTLPPNLCGEIRIEVTEAQGQRVLTVIVSMQVHRGPGAPIPRRRPL